MPHPLTQAQVALLETAASKAISASTLRAHSELRWLEHLGLIAPDGDGRFAITADGMARLSSERSGSLSGAAPRHSG